MNMSNNLRNISIAGGVLVVFIVGAFFALGVKSVFTGTAQAQPSVPNPGHSYQEVGLPAGTWPNLDADKLDGYDASQFGGGGCYNNWNDATCAPGWTAVSTGEWTAVNYQESGAFAMLCAADKGNNKPGGPSFEADTDGDDDYVHSLVHEPCAVCCK